MARNQVRTLLVRAAVRRVVDFSEIDDLNPKHHRRLRLLLKELAAEYNREMQTIMHQHAIAVLSIDRISEESLKNAQKRGTGILDNLLAAYYPWQYDAQSKEEREKKEIKELRDAWQQKFGDLDDPETHRRLQATRTALLEAAQATRPKDLSNTSGIFNKETAALMEGLSSMERLDPNKS